MFLHPAVFFINYNFTMEMEHLKVKPIGHMKSGFLFKNGTPRQPTVAPSSKGEIKISKAVFTNPNHSLQGLDAYSHVWIIFHFHLNSNKGVKAKVKPPRLGVKTGVFSTRSPHRPNPVGLTLAKLESVDGDTLTVSGIDIVDGTPIVDIKPYIPAYDSLTERNFTDTDDDGDDGKPVEKCAKIADWVSEKSTLKVVFTPRAFANVEASKLTSFGGVSGVQKIIGEILFEDPRSVYRRDECKDRLYYFKVKPVSVTVWFDESTTPATAEVLRVVFDDEVKSA